ncbi:MAG: BolA family protein [Myxococcota bacterium]
MFSAERIRRILEENLPDCVAIVEDPANDGTHFQAEVVSSVFVGKSRIQQHQAVYRALGDHMRSDIHALQLKTFTPDVWPHR